MKICLFTFLVLISIGCNHDPDNHKANENKKDHHNHKSEGHKHHTDHNKSNQLMNEHSFEDLAESFEDPEREVWQKPQKVIQKLGNIEGLTIGDIGSGTGYFSFRIAEHKANVVALDVDKRFLNFINDRIKKLAIKNLTTRLVEYEDPKLQNEEFDVLMTVNTYHHFNNKNDYLTKCIEGLKKGGRLMIVDFKKEDVPFGPPIDHKIHESEVKKDLILAGFKTIAIDTESLPYQYIVIGEK